MITRRPQSPTDAEVVPTTLVPLDRGRAETWDHRLYRWFGNLQGWLIVLYLFLDRGGAHLHLPHTPAYVAELLLTFGVVVVVSATRPVRRALSSDVLLTVLVGYMVWGLLRTVPNMATFGIKDAVRDAALWYYGAFAVMLAAAAIAVPELPGRLVRGFSRVLPWLTIWLPAALLLERAGVKGPSFKYSNVPLLSHKPGNICVAAAICLVWLWLVPDPRRGSRARVMLSVVSLLTILLGATQTRGGGLAASVALILGLVLMGKRRSKLIVGLCAGLMLVIGIGGVTGIAYHTQKRTVSVAQLFENAESVSGGQVTNPQLTGSVAFRESLWSTLLDKQVQTSHLVDGFGFGPNLATIGGLKPKPDQSATLQLRSAHNSLLDIFARTGLIGSFIWVLLWVGWYRRMGKARRRSASAGDGGNRGVIEVCMIGCSAIFINCFFDPTLEGAQVAVLNFSLFAMGIICANRPFAIFPGPIEAG